jgi:ABC-type Fe3+/spermidine/putrescine transport system ATPase subunit
VIDTNDSIMSLDGVSRRFTSRANDAVLALDNVSLDIRRNQFITLVGPSGCGKSTLLKIISGIISPTAGSIQFDGSSRGVRLLKISFFQSKCWAGTSLNIAKK